MDNIKHRPPVVCSNTLSNLANDWDVCYYHNSCDGLITVYDVNDCIKTYKYIIPFKYFNLLNLKESLKYNLK